VERHEQRPRGDLRGKLTDGPAAGTPAAGPVPKIHLIGPGGPAFDGMGCWMFVRDPITHSDRCCNPLLSCRRPGNPAARHSIIGQADFARSGDVA
jgi:hypothetical protein